MSESAQHTTTSADTMALPASGAARLDRVHPGHTATVVGISGNAEPLCGTPSRGDGSRARDRGDGIACGAVA